MPPKEGGGWSRPSRPAFKATLGLCLPGELACKERSDACTHTGAGGLAHPCSTTREGAPSSRSLRGWDTMPPKEERRVEQAFQSCVQSHTWLVPSGRTGLQGAKRRSRPVRGQAGEERESRGRRKEGAGPSMQHHERGCPILAFFARVGHDAAQGGRRVEQAFQSCVQSHTRLAPSGRTGLQGAKRRSRPVRGRAGGERESRGRRKERSDACTHSEGAANISPAPRLHRGAKQIGPPEGSPMFSQPKPKAR
jgi:hypothetical protein